MIDRFDHLVLTTAHPDACIRFYTEALGRGEDEADRVLGVRRQRAVGEADQQERQQHAEEHLQRLRDAGLL